MEGGLMERLIEYNWGGLRGEVEVKVRGHPWA